MLPHEIFDQLIRQEIQDTAAIGTVFQEICQDARYRVKINYSEDGSWAGVEIHLVGIKNRPKALGRKDAGGMRPKAAAKSMETAWEEAWDRSKKDAVKKRVEKTARKKAKETPEPKRHWVKFVQGGAPGLGKRA